MEASVTMNDLPTELISHIFSYLADAPAPSSSRLRDKPTVDLTKSETLALKHASSTSKLWRKLALPLLFKHATLEISPESFGTRDGILPMLGADLESKEERVAHMVAQLVERSRSGPSTHRAEIHEFASFLFTKPIDVPLSKYVKSLVLRVSENVTPFDFRVIEFNSEGLWDSIFKSIDPARVTIVAPPAILRWLITSMPIVLVPDLHEWNKAPHILSFECNPTAALPSPLATVPEEEPSEEFVPDRPAGYDPVTRLFWRSWTHLTLNEGLLQGFQDFGQALNTIMDVIYTNRALPPTVIDFAYIAMFPPPMHFANLVWHLPKIRRFYCQIVPRGMSLDLEDNADMRSMWDRRNLSYSYLMRYMLSTDPIGNFRYLEEFQSGDATHTEAFELVSERAISLRKGWRLEGPGVLVRDSIQDDQNNDEDDDDDDDDEDDDDGDAFFQDSIFSGNLRRWAWNGTTTLPVSPLPLYFR